jgi:hypothetical protein
MRVAERCEFGVEIQDPTAAKTENAASAPGGEEGEKPAPFKSTPAAQLQRSASDDARRAPPENPAK